jgi:hypothetical protein
MNSQSALSLARRSTLAALVAGAALLLGACSTTPVAQGPVEKTAEKTYSYAELHQMMLKLSQEPAPASVATMASSSGDLGGSRTLAANP